MKRTADLQSSFETMVTNSTVYSVVSHEIEFEIRRDVPEKNKVLYVLFAMLLGGCGIDRCFMGQICFGVIKAMTFGGFGIWTFCDYILAAHNALTMQSEVNSLGYTNVKFEPNSVESGYYVGAVILGLHVGPTIFYTIIALILACSGCCFAGVVAAAGSTKEGMDEKGAAVRDNAVAVLPFGFASTFRGLGMLNEKPSEAECKSLFKDMDLDGNKKLSKDELSAALVKLGVSAENIDTMIKVADKNNDGEIDESEFVSAAMQ